MGLGTPLHAATRAGRLDLVEFLLRKGANPNIRDSKDRTAADYAIDLKYLEIAVLLERQAERKGDE